MSGETPGTNNSAPNRSAWDSFSEIDLYHPKMPGETDEAYNSRLKFMHQKAAEYLAKEQAHQDEQDYLASEFGQREVEADSKYNRVLNKLNELVREGKISEARARSLSDRQAELTADEISDIQQDYQDSKSVATTEDRARYAAWLRQNISKEASQELDDKLANIDDWLKSGRISEARADALRDEVLQSAARSDSEPKPTTPTEPNKPKDAAPTEDDLKRARERELALARERALHMSRAERLAMARKEQLALDAEIKETERQLALQNAKIEESKIMLEEADLLRAQAENDAEIQRLRQQLQDAESARPLTVINADFTHDKRELAFDLAEGDLNAEVAKAGLIKKLWKGTLFKKYYHRKYANEYLSAERKSDGKTIDELVQSRSGDAIERFILGATEDMRFIHERIGKKQKDGTYDGEKLVEADAETTAAVKTAIEKFAKAYSEALDGKKSTADLEREFKNEISRIKHEAAKGRLQDGLTIDNYLDVAINAGRRFNHERSMERVMEGFKVYNAEVRDSIRTKAHRDNIDKITNAIESSAIGQFIPAEIIAGAVSVASGLGQFGTRALLGATGGMLASSAISGLKERNRITEDRARMLRDIASGMSYEGQSDKKGGKTAKYEARIGGTLYDLQKASDLTAKLQDAFKTEVKSDDLLRTIAEARVRIDFSDSEQKDLIAYTSADKRGSERLQLDIATISAEKSLSDADRQKLELMKQQIQKEIADSVKQKDERFKRERAVMAVKKAGKTLALGATFFLASQEVMAAIDPDKIGIFEKAGLLNTENNTDATETILARGLGLGRNVTRYTTDPIVLRADQEVEIAQLRANGYTEVKVNDAWTETKNVLAEVRPADSTSGVRVIYDGWANNGTTYSDGNELGAYLSNGSMVARMGGISTANGQPLDYDALAAAGRVRGYLTIGGNRFEIAAKVNEAGQLTWGDNGIFTTTTGDTIRAIGDNGEKLYRYFEIAADNGVDADGIRHIIPFAADIGQDSFTGTMQQVAGTIVEHPATYSFVKTTVNEVPRALTTTGIAFAPETARTGLGAARAAETSVNSPVEAPAAPSTSPSTSSPTPEASPSSEPTPSSEPSPEPASSPESSESERFSNEVLEAINEARDRIGGQEGVDILTDTATKLGPENSRRFEAWWDSLDDNGKNAVKELMQKVIGSKFEFDLGWGRAARFWFVANRHL